MTGGSRKDRDAELPGCVRRHRRPARTSITRTWGSFKRSWSHVTETIGEVAAMPTLFGEFLTKDIGISGKVDHAVDDACQSMAHRGLVGLDLIRMSVRSWYTGPVIRARTDPYGASPSNQ